MVLGPDGLAGKMLLRCSYESPSCFWDGRRGLSDAQLVDDLTEDELDGRGFGPNRIHLPVDLCSTT